MLNPTSHHTFDVLMKSVEVGDDRTWLSPTAAVLLRFRRL